MIKRNDQPENILIDYDIVGNNVTKLKIVVGDWGTAKIGYIGGQFCGGTPVYAGPSTFQSGTKDIFSFGRLAMELMLDKPGIESTFSSLIFFAIFETQCKVFLGLTFYPIEEAAILERFRLGLCPFIRAIQKTTSSGLVFVSEVFEEILSSARSGQITNQLSAEWFQFIQAPVNQTLNKDDLVVANTWS